MNRLWRIVIIILFAALGFLGGTLYGFREGVTNFSLLQQIVQGSIARYQLVAMEKNRIDFVKISLELDIDSGLHRYVIYNEHGNKLLSSYFMPEVASRVDRYVDSMAEYRKDHPIVYSPDWANPVEGEDEEARLWREQALKDSEKMLSEIKALLRERGVPEAALTSQGAGAQ